MITHPEKLLFPDAGITKGELAAYYERLAPLILPQLRARPITLERFPSGIGGKGFIQKDVSKGFPEWLERIELPKKGGTVHYPLANDVRSLLWLVNQNSVTLHVWTSHLPELHKPDLCVFDLDPARDEPEILRRASLQVRDLLAELGLESYVKTSGSKGFHIVVPLDGQAEFDSVSRFADGCGALLVQRNPRQLTREFIKADRQGRILVDTGRNYPGATFAVAYTVRPKPEAPISAPCTWSEVESGSVGPRTFTLRSMSQRIAQVGDLWEKLHEHPQSLDSAMERLRGMLSESDWDADRVAKRRKSKAKSKSE